MDPRDPSRTAATPGHTITNPVYKSHTYFNSFEHTYVSNTLMSTTATTNTEPRSLEVVVDNRAALGTHPIV